MDQFIPIEWHINISEKDKYYIDIECYKEKKDKEVYISSNCCNKNHDGCAIEACGCDLERGIRIKLYDIGDNLITQTDWVKNVKRIIVTKDDLERLVIKVENK